MVESGYPYEVDVMNPSTLVFGFPMKAPETAVFRDDRSAIQQLEYWLMWKQFWADHSVSVTVYVKEDEWFEVGAWVYEHFDEITGVSFLPHSDHTYKQAPYEEITEMQYHELLSKMPAGINYELLADLETTDHTTGMREFACTGGACEIV
jgi:ribonucleoside-diphosphate reductase alpha chain